jgi:hypothetical protein
MISLLEPFYHDNRRIEITQSIEVISVHDSKQCKSGIAIRTNFLSLKMQLDIDSKFIFNETEIKFLKNKETRDTFFKNFVASTDYGI